MYVAMPYFGGAISRRVIGSQSHVTHDANQSEKVMTNFTIHYAYCAKIQKN